MTKTNQARESLRRFLRVDLIIIVLVVITVDLAARASSLSALKIDWNELDAPYRTRMWWAEKDFLRLGKTPNVVLLGSSTMTCAMYGAEAMFTKRIQNELLKHKSDYLENKLKKLHVDQHSTFCLAIPGQVPSDAYMIVRTLFSKDRTPKVIVYGIMARDFIDATFNDPAASATFKLMSLKGNFPEMQYSCRDSFWERVNYLVGQLSFIYGHKQRLVCAQHHAVQEILAKFDGKQFEPISTPAFIRKQAMLQLPEDFAPHDVQDLYDPNHLLSVDNLDEYRARYRLFRPNKFEQQLKFFKGVVDYSREQNIRLYIANMPITSDNRKLIPPAVYALYQAKTSEIARNGGAQYVDFDNKDFVPSDFFDSVHLNQPGGQKMMDRIAALILTGLESAENI